MEQQCHIKFNSYSFSGTVQAIYWFGLVLYNTSFSPCCSESSSPNYWPTVWTTTKCPTVMNMECPDYSEMQVCLQLRFRQTPPPQKMSKRTMHTTVKTSLKPLACSSLSLEEEGGCKHKMLSYDSTAQKARTHKPSPRNYTATMTTRLSWHTIHAHYVGAKQGWRQKSHKAGHEIPLFFSVLWLTWYYGTALAFPCWHFLFVFFVFFCHRASSPSKADFLLLTCCWEFGR